MITDRISLNLLALYLEQFEANEGKIDSIELSFVSKYTGVNKGITAFPSIAALRQYINQYAPLTNVDEPECYPLNLYELKSFNVTSEFAKDGSTSNKNFIINRNRTFVTDSTNINKASMQILNVSYMGEFLKVLKEFNDLVITEYIQNQWTYIDCGYIEVYFNDALERIIELYKKYKHT